MCPENVDRLCAMLCSSPMSMKTAGKTETTDVSSAGMKRPVCAISVSRPIVFSATVLPPVFGPVMSRTRKSSPSSTSIGTTVGRIEQRVARATQRDAVSGMAVRACSSAGPERRPVRAHVERQTRLGHGQVDRGGRLDRARDLLGSRADLVAERVEDAVDLVLLVELALAPAVVQLDDLERLDEERLTAGRRVVDDAWQLSSGVRAHRHDVAAVARGDDRVLEHRRVLAAADERVQPLHQPAVGDPHVAPDPAQFGAGGVQHVARAGRSTG